MLAYDPVEQDGASVGPFRYLALAPVVEPVRRSSFAAPADGLGLRAGLEVSGTF